MIASLNAEPPRGGLDLTQEQADELALDALLADPDIGPAVKRSSSRLKFWDICQIPDYHEISSSIINSRRGGATVGIEGMN